jgi:hypothetical protein
MILPEEIIDQIVASFKNPATFGGLTKNKKSSIKYVRGSFTKKRKSKSKSQSYRRK